MKYLILALNLFIFISCSSQNASKCKCDGMEVIYQLQEKEKRMLIVCGFLDEETTVSEKIVFSLLVKDCKNDKIIIDYSNDEIHKHILSRSGQEIKIFSTKFILRGDDWRYELAKETEQIIFIDKGVVKLSKSKDIFITPSLTIAQKSDLSKLCKCFQASLKKNNKMAYPNDEKSIYMLYMGLLNNDDESKYILQNLRSFFDVDGAISETLSEVGF